MDAGTLRGVFTAIMLLLFVGVCVWAYSSRRKADFEEAAQLPLGPDGDEIPPEKQS
ncbi:MAG: cbb3-type cytochrome c oxidase subunit 3 [Gammaproteobacteria bacterium]|nr:cbb3-type cytochrome c oxidase subunit 3 [Gammaproteobacteria bacterium]